MTPDELRDQAAIALWQAESKRAGGRARLVPWTEAGDHAHEKYRSMADEAIRVALRAAQAAMRDQLIFTGECAKQPPSSLIERAGFDMCVRAVAALIPEEAKP